MLGELAIEGVVLLLKVVDLILQKLINLALVRRWHHVLGIVNQILDCFVDSLRAMLVACTDIRMMGLVASHLSNELLRHVVDVFR